MMAKRMTTLVSKGRMKGRKNGETLEREGRLKVEECSPVWNDHVGVQQVRHRRCEDFFLEEWASRARDYRLSRKINSLREVLRTVKPWKLFEDKVLKVGKWRGEGMLPAQGSTEGWRREAGREKSVVWKRVGMKESLMREGVVGKYVKEESLNKGRDDRRTKTPRIILSCD